MSPVNFPPPSLRRQVARNVAVRDTCLRSPFRDRKSTRLNSSHGYKSYAVFCLKKKATTHSTTSSSPPRRPDLATSFAYRDAVFLFNRDRHEHLHFDRELATRHHTLIVLLPIHP